MAYYQNGRKKEFKENKSWYVFVANGEDAYSYCIYSKTDGGEGAIVEYWDGCEKLTRKELDIACDVRVAQLKITGEHITLRSRSGRELTNFDPFF